MNNAKFKKTLLLAIASGFVWWAWKSPAQETPATTDSMQMPYAVTQVLELEQAKIGDSTTIAYINSSGTSFNLTAAQIVFLRGQGVSDAVITAMLTQPHAGVTTPSVQATAPPAQTPPPAPAAITAATADMTPDVTTADPTIITQPQVTYVQTAPAPVSYFYYPSYTWCGWPSGWAWYGGAWHWGWGGGWHGGGSVGWHGGSGWHGGGWSSGWHGGGGSWHGGGGGGWHGGGGGGWHH